MFYQVPQHIDPNKVFLINHSELEGRFDSDFYNPSYYQIFDSEKVKWVRLKSVIENLKHPPEYKRVFATEGYQLIRSQNVRPTGINLSDNPVFLADEVVQSSSTIFPHVNDILIVRSGVNAGDVAVVEEEFKNVIIGADTLLLNVTKDVLPKFVQIYFMTDIGRKQLNRHITGATNKHLNSFSLKRVYFPKVDIEIQSKCISIIESAFVENIRKNEQAKGLLESIDSYLLGELGIQLPEMKSQALQDRMFLVNSSEVSGRRFDPKSVLFLGESAKSIKYENAQLKQIAKIEKGDSITSDEVNKEGQYPVIAGGQTSPYNHDTFNYAGDIITVSASGAYSGYVWYHNYPIFASDCSVIYAKNNQQFLTQYIFEVLKAQQSHIYLLQQGAGQPHVYPDDLSTLWIPAIPLKKQQEIVDHISAIRKQAKALQEEGKSILEQTKKEVEQMILG